MLKTALSFKLLTKLYNRFADLHLWVRPTVGAGIGGGAGALLGSLLGPKARTLKVLIGALSGAGLGAGVGYRQNKKEEPTTTTEAKNNVPSVSAFSSNVKNMQPAGEKLKPKKHRYLNFLPGLSEESKRHKYHQVREDIRKETEKLIKDTYWDNFRQGGRDGARMGLKNLSQYFVTPLATTIHGTAAGFKGLANYLPYKITGNLTFNPANDYIPGLSLLKQKILQKNKLIQDIKYLDLSNINTPVMRLVDKIQKGTDAALFLTTAIKGFAPARSALSNPFSFVGNMAAPKGALARAGIINKGTKVPFGLYLPSLTTNAFVNPIYKLYKPFYLLDKSIPTSVKRIGSLSTALHYGDWATGFLRPEKGLTATNALKGAARNITNALMWLNPKAAFNYQTRTKLPGITLGVLKPAGLVASQLAGLTGILGDTRYTNKADDIIVTPNPTLRKMPRQRRQTSQLPPIIPGIPNADTLDVVLTTSDKLYNAADKIKNLKLHKIKTTALEATAGGVVLGNQLKNSIVNTVNTIGKPVAKILNTTETGRQIVNSIRQQATDLASKAPKFISNDVNQAIDILTDVKGWKDYAKQRGKDLPSIAKLKGRAKIDKTKADLKKLRLLLPDDVPMTLELVRLMALLLHNNKLLQQVLLDLTPSGKKLTRDALVSLLKDRALHAPNNNTLRLLGLQSYNLSNWDPRLKKIIPTYASPISALAKGFFKDQTSNPYSYLDDIVRDPAKIDLVKEISPKLKSLKPDLNFALKRLAVPNLISKVKGGAKATSAAVQDILNIRRISKILRIFAALGGSKEQG